MANAWRRLSDRLSNNDEPDALFEGVPDHLDHYLRQWLVDVCNNYPIETFLAIRLRLPSKLRGDRAGLGVAIASYIDPENPIYVLDAIDAALDMVANATRRTAYVPEFEALADVLREGGSAFQISSDRHSLERRVDVTVKAAATLAIAIATTTKSGSAADHLANAWKAVYGISPSPSLGYSEAIKAVEAAAHAVLEPNNQKATLGTMIGALKNSPGSFRLAISAEVAPLVAMLEALWKGQTSRHGAQTVTRPESLEQAQAAVHLAATLVQWFAAGAVSKI